MDLVVVGSFPISSNIKFKQWAAHEVQNSLRYLTSKYYSKTKTNE